LQGREVHILDPFFSISQAPGCGVGAFPSLNLSEVNSHHEVPRSLITCRYDNGIATKVNNVLAPLLRLLRP